MSSELSPRVGYIGSGWTERIQIPAFMLGGLTPQAIASASRENAQRVAAKFDIPEVFTDWRELIASPNVDLVSIVTPPHLHREIAIASLKAGKHILCEKPMALNVGEAEEMFAAAQDAPGCLAIIDHELRFHPIRMQLREMLKEGVIGVPLRMELTRLGPDRLTPATPFTWWSDAQRGGGMLGAVGSHMIDLARWYLGRIEGVVGDLQTAHRVRTDPVTKKPREVTADDHADILFRLGSGVQGHICASGMTPGGYGLDTLVVGSEGAIRLDNQDRLWLKHGAEYPTGEWEAVRAKYPLADLPGLPANNPFAIGSYYLAQTLATLIPMGESVLPDAASFYDGLVVQRVMDAVRESHATRAWVAL